MPQMAGMPQQQQQQPFATFQATSFQQNNNSRPSSGMPNERHVSLDQKNLGMSVWTQKNTEYWNLLPSLEFATIKGILMRNVGLKGLGLGWAVPCRWMH